MNMNSRSQSRLVYKYKGSYPSRYSLNSHIQEGVRQSLLSHIRKFHMMRMDQQVFSVKVLCMKDALMRERQTGG